VRLSAIGDVVRTLPAINAWHRQSPETRFTWLVEPAAASVLQGHPAIDKVLIFERGLFGDFLRSPGNIVRAMLSLSNLISDLRAGKFDLAIDFHGILKSALFARLSGAPKRVGFARPEAKEGSALFYTHHFKPLSSELNRVVRAVAMVESLGVESAEPIACQLPVTALNREQAYASLDLLSELPGKGPVIALHPGSSRKTAYKRWHRNGYVGLVNALVEKLDARVILTWGPGERETVELIAGHVRVPLVVAKKTSSLLDLAALFAACDLFIGGDTGPAHLAAAMQTPVVVIFGPTHPRVNAPCGTPYRIVRHPLPCSPCRKRSCKNRLCLEAIGWRRVIVAVEEILA
jgi:lipopolysaccharide heptosyltransferase I